MNTLEAIKARQSIRTFHAQSVEQDKLNDLLEAANAAPIFGCIHLTVIENKELIHSIGEITKSKMLASGNEFAVQQASASNYNPTYNAPVFLVFSAKGGNDNMGFNMGNVSCAAQNVLLAATELGLASCFVMAPMMAFTDENVFLKAGIPEDYIPLVGVCIGYSSQTASLKERPAKDNVNFC